MVVVIWLANIRSELTSATAPGDPMPSIIGARTPRPRADCGLHRYTAIRRRVIHGDRERGDHRRRTDGFGHRRGVRAKRAPNPGHRGGARATGRRTEALQ